MDTINQDFGSSEQCTSSRTEVEKKMLRINGCEVMECVSCIKQEEDDGTLRPFYTDQQCTQMLVAIKEEPTDNYLEGWEELELVPVKEEVNPEIPIPFREIESDISEDGALLKKSVDGYLVVNAKEGGETCPSVNGARVLNGDSNRILQKKNEHKTVEATPEAVRKRRRHKSHYSRHLSDRPFQCKICQKCFRKPEHLRCHELFHSDERQFLCDTCGKGFFTNGDLKRHGVVHTGEKPYSCPICSKTFTQLCNMQSHLRKRCQIKGYGCDLCNRMFEDQGALQKHKANHGKVPYRCNKRRKPFCQDLPPFICDVCSMCFSNKRNLISHIKVHMGDLKATVTCEICGKNCARRERLIVHMRSHTGEKPFSCSVCGRAFSQQCNLKKHEALHLPD
ncbi:zinc finger protein OZF-like isoform X1 [Schistocerca nitens]|uniref:zinc finger protein OZF-like isoform X1 n=2 Tax=Schistocerca nitens TaxID=7011 RepID=UPI002118AA2C|nr:zinc finger protein OZF-like isoform X1 [Schistocerca nitens]